MEDVWTESARVDTDREDAARANVYPRRGLQSLGSLLPIRTLWPIADSSASLSSIQSPKQISTGAASPLTQSSLRPIKPSPPPLHFSLRLFPTSLPHHLLCGPVPQQKVLLMAGGPSASGPGLGANAPKSKLAGILMVSFAAFAGILFGYDTGTISGITAMKDWLRLFGSPTSDTVNHPTGYMITSSQQSLVTSILSAGTFFGKCHACRLS